MKSRVNLIGSLALAGVMLLAGPVWAQGPGAGAGPRNNQVCTGGPGGVCVVNPAPATGANQTGQGKANSRMRRGAKQPGPGGRMNQPAAPTPAPEAAK